MVDQCLQLYEEMIYQYKIEPNAVIYSTILSACERCVPPRPHLALKILVEATTPLEALEEVDGVDGVENVDVDQKKKKKKGGRIVKRKQMDGQMNIVAYNAAMSACARSGQWRLAMTLLKEMQRQQYAPSTALQTQSDLQIQDYDDEEEDVEEEDDDDEDEDDDDDEIVASENETGSKSNTKAQPSKKRILHPNTITPAPDQITYGTVMAACERSGKWHQVLKVARSIQHYGSGNTNRNNNSKGTSSKSSKTSSSVVRLDGVALTSALHACQQLGLADEALYYLDQMKQLKKQEEEERQNGGSAYRRRQKPPLSGPDAVAYRLAISACARSRRSINYAAIDDEDNEGDSDNSSTSQQQHSYGGGARWEDGIRLLNEIEDVTGKAPDVVTYTAAIVGCAEAGQWKEAFRLLKEMKTKYGIAPNVVTYSAVISACATASANAAAEMRSSSGGLLGAGSSVGSGGWYEEEELDMNASEVKNPLKAALALLDKMVTDERLNVKPNIVTYNAAIRAAAEGLDVKKAFELMKELKEAGLEPTIVTYGSLMTACERVGNVEGMSLVFRAMKAFSASSSSSTDNNNSAIKPNDVIYGAAISCCRKAGESERAFLLLLKMIRDGIQPNTATFNTAIIAQAEGSTSGNSESSAPTAKQSQQMDKAIEIYKLMTTKEVEQQQQSQSRKRATDNSIKSSSPNRHTYNILISALSANKRPADAEMFLRKMRADGYVPDVDLFTSTVTSYERTRNHLRALELMESMTEYGYDFYEVKLLDKAFKKAIKLANAVAGRSRDRG